MLVEISGNVRFSGSIGCLGSISVTGLNTLAVSVLNLSVTLFASSVGGMPKLSKFISSNTGVGGNCSGVLVLGVLVIAGDHLSVVCLLNGYAIPGLGPAPDIHEYAGVNTDVGVEVTGVSDAGGLSSSALSKCSSPEVAFVLSLGLGSESELSGALKLQRFDSP